MTPDGSYVVPESLAGERVDRAVALLTGWARADVQALLAEGAVLVSGRAVAKSHRIEAGDVVAVLGEPRGEEPPGPEPVPLAIRYEDDDIVVIAKPAGLIVHPGAGHPGGTLVNGLLARYPEIATVGDPGRPGIVHRLDADTSGLLVVARTDRAYSRLVAQLAAREVGRHYDALVWGRPTGRGVIDAPIGRSESRRTRMAVRDDGKPARTAFSVVKSWARPGVSLLDCRLETGRTHQIRVHLAAIGHPVVGDATYGGRRESIALARPFLHARYLAFAHPATGDTLEFSEPRPDDLERVLADLGAPDETS